MIFIKYLKYIIITYLRNVGKGGVLIDSNGANKFDFSWD